MQNVKSTGAKAQPAPAQAPRSPAPLSLKPKKEAAPPPLTGPLFRRIDWISFWVVTVLTMIGYWWTLAPDVTLEDSGELATASMYAGVPHPPGYPFWTVYSWLFTKILPFSNIAWRVAVSSAAASAFACGICALLTSRGCSALLESVEWFKDIERKVEEQLCIVSAIVAGLLLGFNGYIWSQAVIVEVYTLGVLNLLLVLACLFRWVYSPDDRKYLYWAWFLFGLCLVNHQTLFVAAMGIEVVVAAADKRLGRNFFAGNTLIWLLVLFLNATGSLGTFKENPALFLLFNLIGVASACTAIWLALETRTLTDRWIPALLCGVLFFAGASFYLYMALASMSNPPLNWGYPRTWDGFIHAFTRGQYEKANPGISLPQIWLYLQGCAEEFNIVNLLLALVPFFFWRLMQRRERGWLVGLTAIYFCLAFVLLYLLNPTTDRQSRELVKVFFTSSHVMIAMAVGYALALIGGCLLCRFDDTRRYLLIGGAVACGLNLYEAVDTFQTTQFPLLRFATVFSLGISVVFVGLLYVLFFRRSGASAARPVLLSPFLALFLAIPADSILSHWSDNEQRGHLFGFWFGHDMFDPTAIKGADGKPLYPEMARDAVLFGGTDPGRFNPTYMIFCESFIKPEQRRDPKFDRRDVALITQNALADLTYLNYIRAHYNRSEQIDPPFFQEMVQGAKNREVNRKTFLMSLVKPLDDLFLSIGERIEHQRRAGTSYFKPEHFTNADQLKAKLNAAADPLSKYLKEQLGDAASGDPRTLARALNKVLDSGILYSKERFSGIPISSRNVRFATQQLSSHAKVRANRLLLEEAYPGLITKSPGGVYPDLEVITPTTADSSRCFQDYMSDAQRRMMAKALKPGEYVQQTADGRVSVSGQVAVMAINALLCKVIFDKNPESEFYIEESFPLDWMFPYLTPYGIIMKINRNPVPEITDEMCRRDHEFWSKYSERFIGNWITYDTPVKEITEFSKRVYLRRDMTGFKGEPAFIRDDNAQKAFSKLRGAIGGVYSWRINNTRNAEEQQRLLREAEFAFKQALAFCPYSPEAVFRYCQLLIGLGRSADAYEVARTAYEFDVENLQIRDLARNLESMKDAPPPQGSIPSPTNRPIQSIPELEAKYKANPKSGEAAFGLASAYFNVQRHADGYAILDRILEDPAADGRSLLSLAEAYRRLNNVAKLESALSRYVHVASNSPEAWYDYAAILGVQGKAPAAAPALARAFDLSNRRLATNKTAMDLRGRFKSDNRFDAIRGTPEFSNFK